MRDILIKRSFQLRQFFDFIERDINRKLDTNGFLHCKCDVDIVKIEDDGSQKLTSDCIIEISLYSIYWGKQDGFKKWIHIPARTFNTETVQEFDESLNTVKETLYADIEEWLKPNEYFDSLKEIIEKKEFNFVKL